MWNDHSINRCLLRKKENIGMFDYVCYKKILNLFYNYNQNEYCIIIETIEEITIQNKLIEKIKNDQSYWLSTKS